LCLAFSKTLKGHVAGMALGVFAYNFVREHSALGKRRTPAMAAGLTDHPWTIAELVEAALAVAEEEPGDLPEAVPLAMPASRGGKPVGASRPLPGGRGFLRSVVGPAPSAKGAPPLSTPPAPGAPPPAPAVAVVPDPAQLDLFAWKPRPAAPARPLPPKGAQLDLFDR
jgi:hypothetical protein